MSTCPKKDKPFWRGGLQGEKSFGTVHSATMCWWYGEVTGGANRCVHWKKKFSKATAWFWEAISIKYFKGCRQIADRFGGQGKKNSSGVRKTYQNQKNEMKYGMKLATTRGLREETPPRRGGALRKAYTPFLLISRRDRTKTLNLKDQKERPHV